MRSRMLLLLAAVALAAVIPMTASGHERKELGSAEASAMYSFMTEGKTDGMLGLKSMADPQPLTGEGRNMEIVANVPMEGSVAASDLELAGNYAYVGSYGEGMVIVDITNPREPKRAGVFNCPGGQNDVQLQPGSDPQYAVLAIESTANECHPQNEGFVLIDISDKANPREVAFVGQEVEEGGVQDGAHNTTMDWPYLYVDQYQPTHGDQEGRNGQVDIFDLRQLIENPAEPKPVARLDTPGGGAHDMQVDHRPDGSVLGYAASIGFTDVYDLKDPANPKILQRLSAGEHGVGISHGLEPNFDRTIAIETDEYGGGSGVLACGDRVEEIPLPGGLVSTVTPGSVHFLRLAEDGQLATIGAKVEQVGAYNTPAATTSNPNDGCTSHVFWQAPDENRMVIAWYGRGARVVDFSDPANPLELGHYHATGGEAWSAKPHKGYIFVGDTVRGLDVLEYTGEECKRWPTTSGAAEVQRARYQGTEPPPEAPASTPPGCGGKPTNEPPIPASANQDPGPELTDTPNNAPGNTGNNQNQNQPPQQQPQGGKQETAVGGYRFMRVVRARKSGARRKTVTLQILSADRKVLATRRYRVRGGKRTRIRAAIGGAVGRYGWRVREGRRTLKQGSFSVKTASRIRVNGASAQRLRIGRLPR